MVKGKVVPALN